MLSLSSTIRAMDFSSDKSEIIDFLGELLINFPVSLDPNYYIISVFLFHYPILFRIDSLFGLITLSFANELFIGIASFIFVKNESITFLI